VRIAILGAGKMGAWLASALAAEHVIAVYDRDPARARTVKGARALGRLEDVSRFEPDLLVNAVPLVATIAAFEEVAPHLPRSCIVADMASIKGDIPAWYRRSGLRFASVHPMFGPTFANLDALKRENAILIRESDPETKALFRRLFEGFGLTLFEYSFAEHDRMMAYSLATPFACTMAFAAGIDQSVVPGTTFAKHLAIARGLLSEDDELVVHILINAQAQEQIGKLAKNLETLRRQIEQRDEAGVQSLLASLRRNVS
jgi:prephenate dehydrogenase